ncbi:hypothetical protein Poli38472_010440 [Pythium oligandrum]|uniref:Glycosyl transferase family 1 domain-containing protein n=1 Tax=Pythium oligandrum TaxID=41045 RepID=A0A8K1FE64_PYTOL|nr:hypothetical protein Poli38472_010440 [Pythium oligandrum]|eukprot:TMW55558.1 hypothetical protein Poli38472_010440 [Pythium oligandrum]
MELANLMPERLDVDVLIAPSHFALHHPSVARSVTARSRHVMFTGVDTTLFAPSTNIFRSEVFTIGYVGRLSTEKSVGVLLSVAKLLVDRGIPCRVRIIGDGSQRERLKALTASWNLSSIVTFTAAIYDPPRLAEEFQRLDVYVSPCFEETLGIAPLEAMSCGVPVVGFATGGVGEFLEDGVNGIAIKEPTAEAMTEAIMLLYQNSLRQRLGAQARQTVEHRFSDRRGIQQYLALYERLRKPR